jgi:protein-S-isoprenylcysteine O-methyltransferase Ste14
MSETDVHAVQTESGDAAIIRRAVRKLVLASIIFGGILFGAAGDPAWTMGWVFWGVLTACMVSTTWFLAQRHPDLLAERLGIRPGAKKWDIVLASGMAVWTPLAGIVVAGLDHRWGWTETYSPAIEAAGVLLLLIGHAIVFWSMASNRFFSAVVRIQTERGHHVVSEGPYRWIRHPGYLGAMFYMIAYPFILDSHWAWIPLGAAILLTLLRTALEDRTLRRELPGYASYAAKVRWRLLPGIW